MTKITIEFWETNKDESERYHAEPVTVFGHSVPRVGESLDIDDVSYIVKTVMWAASTTSGSLRAIVRIQ